eukprot:138972_1
MASQLQQRRIVIVGATGYQGRAVVAHLLQTESDTHCFDIIGLTRNPSSKKCMKQLSDASASKHRLSFIKCDISLGKEHIKKSFEGARLRATAVFILTLGIDIAREWSYSLHNEVETGRDLIEAAAESNISFVVFSSIVSGEKMNHISHCYAKHLMENILHKYADSFRDGYIILRTPHFMENIQRYFPVNDGCLQLPINPTTIIQHVSVEDIGRIAALHFNDYNLQMQHKNHILDVIGDEATGNEMAQILSNVSGTKIRFYKGPAWFFWFANSGLIPALQSLKQMYEYYDDPGLDGDVEECNKCYGNMITLQQFAMTHYKDDKSIGFSWRKRIIVAGVVTSVAVAGSIWWYKRHKNR